jgi:hypothetical protein
MVAVRVIGLLAVLMVCATANAQLTKEEAQLQADIEKAKADAAASKAAARKSELELQQAEEKARLELQSKQDAADEARRKAISDAIKSVSDLKADAKDVTVTGTAIETKALAYRALNPIAKRIVTEIGDQLCGGNAVQVVLADDQLIGAIPAYQAGVATLQTLNTQYESMIKQARKSFTGLKDDYQISTRSFAATLPFLLQGVAAVGALVQTFKTQLGVTNADVSIDTLALHGALASQWPRTCSKGGNLAQLTAYPNMNLAYASSDVGKEVTALNASFNMGLELEAEITIWLTRTKEAAARAAAAKKPAAQKPKPAKTAQATADKAKAKVDSAKPPPEKPKPKPKPKPEQSAQRQAAEAESETLAAIEAILAKLKAANQRIEQAIQALVATSEKQPVSPLVQLLKLERFAKAIGNSNTNILTVKAVAGGGNTVTTNSFWSGPKVFHSGGAVLAYTLTGHDGVYIRGGVLDMHVGYVQLEVSGRSSLGSSWSEPGGGNE